MTVVTPIHSAEDCLTQLKQVAVWLSDAHNQDTLTANETLQIYDRAAWVVAIAEGIDARIRQPTTIPVSWVGGSPLSANVDDQHDAPSMRKRI